MTRLNRIRSGAAAVELAVLLPFLALMFAAVLDFGRVYGALQTLEDCARAGAHYAAGHTWLPASTDRATAAKTAACNAGVSLSPALAPDNVTVTPNDAVRTVTVRVRYEFALFTPILGPTRTVTLVRSVTLNVAPVPGG
jgi:Flp pilus assembly protein TadG